MSDLEDEMAETMAKEMQKEIDGEILRTCLVETGWIQVKFIHKDREQSYEIRDWCETNIKNFQWAHLGNYYLFNNKKDAEWFILRWT